MRMFHINNNKYYTSVLIKPCTSMSDFVELIKVLHNLTKCHNFKSSQRIDCQEGLSTHPISVLILMLDTARKVCLCTQSVS